jgi:hypothetical protein
LCTVNIQSAFINSHVLCSSNCDFSSIWNTMSADELKKNAAAPSSGPSSILLRDIMEEKSFLLVKASDVSVTPGLSLTRQLDIADLKMCKDDIEEMLRDEVKELVVDSLALRSVALKDVFKTLRRDLKTKKFTVLGIKSTGGADVDLVLVSKHLLMESTHWQ